MKKYVYDWNIILIRKSYFYYWKNKLLIITVLIILYKYNIVKNFRQRLSTNKVEQPTKFSGSSPQHFLVTENIRLLNCAFFIHSFIYF